MNSVQDVNPIRWDGSTLFLLDQRALPHEEILVECTSVNDVYDAIKDMIVRGAPAIGITAAYGTVISAMEHCSEKDFASLIIEDINFLNSSRPTAVNLAWALNEIEQILESSSQDSVVANIRRKAEEIHRDDIANNVKMGDLATDVFRQFETDAFNVMTHCNAGGLATGGYGTALGAIRSAWKNNLIDTVFANETRPWMQGARLTVWELKQSGIPATLCTEGASAWVMKEKAVRWIVVGADRIAANGDVANKIGTYGLSILAKQHNAKLMVVAPTSTIDMNCRSGEQINIEQRDSCEILFLADKRLAPEGVDAFNPVFDVTPASLVSCIVTERGVVMNPDAAKMRALFQ